MNLYRNRIRIKGIVQGVGFRPFVYRTACLYEIKGWVGNTPEGVIIEAIGEENQLKGFLEELRTKAPSLAQVREIIIDRLEMEEGLEIYRDFSIRESIEQQGVVTLISPDIALCKDCEKEMTEEKNKRYRYPFTNCTSCGPRFSIIRKLPYDRPYTTMDVFKMCPSCQKEYEEPSDRRFHAQPNACPVCGPRVWLEGSMDNIVETKEALNKAVLLLKKGAILGIKGIGGFHLVCDGGNERAVEVLRERKARPSKPFALMMKNIETAKQHCIISEVEQGILQGAQRPILLLQKKEDLLPKNVAPKQKTLGVMLPYTPLHHLLFDEDVKVLVMTSANISGMPIEYNNEEARTRLKTLVDYFLFHDREIYIPVEDSVAKVVMGEERLVRRARGYAPMSFSVETEEEILASGAYLKNSFCISKNKQAFLSEYIGDLGQVEVYDRLKAGIRHFQSLYDIQPKLLAVDVHPDYYFEDLLGETPLKKLQVQHHHAHIVSCMAENQVQHQVIGIAFDGNGFGWDGKSWGGEFFIADHHDFYRVGHLDYVQMPGGDAAAKEPWRMALSYLYKAYGKGIEEGFLTDLPKMKVKMVLSMLQKNIHCPETSSIGRLFDAIAGLLGICSLSTYEGQAAIELENSIDTNEKGIYPYDIEKKGSMYHIKVDKMIRQIFSERQKQVSKEKIAARFHNTIIDFSVELCKRIRDEHGIIEAALSGGVFQNDFLLVGLYKALVAEGFLVYTHKQIPCNDGGIAYGQMMIASAKMRRDEDVCGCSS